VFKQALRELHSRYHGAFGIYIDRELARMDLAEMEHRPRTSREELELVRLRMRLEGAERMLRDTARELARFFAHCRALRPTLGELTPERWEELEAEEAALSIRRTAALETTIYGQASQSTLEAIMSFAPEMRARLIQAVPAGSGDAQHKWLSELADPVPALPVALPVDEVIAMIASDVATRQLVSRETNPAGVAERAEMADPARTHRHVMGSGCRRSPPPSAAMTPAHPCPDYWDEIGQERPVFARDPFARPVGMEHLTEDEFEREWKRVNSHPIAHKFFDDWKAGRVEPVIA
jgi:hypothetical protein